MPLFMDMVPKHPGKFMGVLEFFPLSRAWKVLEIYVVQENSGN